MSFYQMLMDIINYIRSTDNNTLQIFLTGVFVVLYLITRNLTSRLTRRYGRLRGYNLPRIKYTVKYINFVFFMVFMMFLGLVWDISFQGLSVYFVSFFTVAGIALFASWSILSNITAAILLFFYFPYKIGSKVRIMDGNDSVEGLIVDLSLFTILIKNDEGHIISYPNNLVLQKAIVILSEA
jgi:MscS family membrane protein